MDLIKHEYVEEEVKTQEAKEGQPEAKKAKMEANEEEETKMVKKSMEFVDLEKALNVDWSQDTYAKRIRRMDPAYFILQILLEFQSREGKQIVDKGKQNVNKLFFRLFTPGRHA